MKSTAAYPKAVFYETYQVQKFYHKTPFPYNTVDKSHRRFYQAVESIARLSSVKLRAVGCCPIQSHKLESSKVRFLGFATNFLKYNIEVYVSVFLERAGTLIKAGPMNSRVVVGSGEKSRIAKE